MLPRQRERVFFVVMEWAWDGAEGWPKAVFPDREAAEKHAALRPRHEVSAVPYYEQAQPTLEQAYRAHLAEEAT